jgi:hypothetical protein
MYGYAQEASCERCQCGPESRPAELFSGRTFESDLRRGLDAYFHEYEKPCIYIRELRVSGFPIEVKEVPGLNTRQLQVLEKHGLLVSWEPTSSRQAKRRRYELPEWGKTFYTPEDFPYSLCFGKKSVDKIVSWTYESSGTAAVTYRYKIEDLAGWAKAADAQREFPEIRLILADAAKAQKPAHLWPLGPGDHDWGVPYW